MLQVIGYNIMVNVCKKSAKSKYEVQMYTSLPRIKGGEEVNGYDPIMKN